MTHEIKWRHALSHTLQKHAVLGLACVGAAVPTLGFAQEASGLEEIIVTAQRREESLQDVPIAVAAVTAQALQNSGIDTTRDLPQMIPSVQFTRSGPSGLIFIRGVGTTNAAAGEESANAVYVDGVYLADLAQAINNFNNIERVEVLKGPQGTLFGRNATGGLIHVITRDPGDEQVATGDIGFANYDTWRARAYFATPIGERFSWDLAFTKLDQRKGWGDNLTLDRENNIQDYWGLRSKLVFRAMDGLKFTLAGDYYENDDNTGIGWRIDPGTLAAGGVPGVEGHDTVSNDYPFTRLKIFGGSLTTVADLGFATLTSISAMRKSENHSDFDVDGTPARLIRIVYNSGAKSIQQEFRLASAETEPLSWQAGLFYLRSEAANNSRFVIPQLAPLGFSGQHIVADLKTDSYAAFAEAAYSLTDATKLTLGVRYTEDHRKFDGAQAFMNLTGSDLAFTPAPVDELKYSEWTYRVALAHQFTPNINAYASFNHGFKSGSFSLQSPLNAPYEPQFIDAYEVGLKTQLFDNRLRLNVSAYHYDIDDYQVRSAATTSLGSSLILNAATVKVDGVDVEFEAAPIANLRIFGGFTWLDSRFDKFGGPNAEFQAPITYPQPATCPPGSLGSKDPGVLTPGPRVGGFQTCFGDVAGNDTPNAPEFTGSLGFSYSMPLAGTSELRFSALYSYNDGYVFESDNVAKQGSYDLVNASIEYRPTDKYGIEIWGRNLTDEYYAVQKITTATGVTSALGEPRTYGINFKFDF